MRKLSIVLLVLVVAFFSMTVLASNDDKTDGVAISWQSATPNDLTISRDEFTKDVNGNSQDAIVTLQAKAYIPCYISLKVTGNGGEAKAESFGPDAIAAAKPDNFYLAFDNELGGFVDEDWKLIGRGKNFEQAPGTGVYIQGCDTFKVQIYANDTYAYQVLSNGLTGSEKNAVANALLPLQMSTADSLDIVKGALTTFDGQTATCQVSPQDGYKACTETTKYHKFRVPYTTNTVHGEYTGTITFRAYLL